MVKDGARLVQWPTTCPQPGAISGFRRAYEFLNYVGLAMPFAASPPARFNQFALSVQMFGNFAFKLQLQF
jgi:hypothetical protein